MLSLLIKLSRKETGEPVQTANPLARSVIALAFVITPIVLVISGLAGLAGLSAIVIAVSLWDRSIAALSEIAFNTPIVIAGLLSLKGLVIIPVILSAILLKGTVLKATTIYFKARHASWT